MSKLLTPEIRFKGYEDEWLPKSLAEPEFDIQAGGDVDKSRLKTKGKYPVIANALTGGGIFGYYDDYFRIKAPAISITGRGEVGVAVPRRDNFTPIVRLLALTSPNDIDFLTNAINQHPVTLESTGVPQLTVPKLQSYKISFPSISEQKEIGNFFKRIDELLLETEREISRLEKMKAASLQKMFPRPGESTPEIRFNGYNGEWSTDPLNSICHYASSNLKVSDAMYLGKYTLYDANNPIGYTNTDYINQEYISIIKDGAGVGRVRILPANSFIIGTLGAILPNSDCNIDFLFCVLLNLKLDSKVSGSTIPHIYFSEYGKIYITYPSYAEQIAIGEYFKNLDLLLNAKRQKLAKLRNIKQACLEKMFVNTTE